LHDEGIPHDRAGLGVAPESASHGHDHEDEPTLAGAAD
jgi:hypothetical protein